MKYKIRKKYLFGSNVDTTGEEVVPTYYTDFANSWVGRTVLPDISSYKYAKFLDPNYKFTYSPAERQEIEEFNKDMVKAFKTGNNALTGLDILGLGAKQLSSVAGDVVGASAGVPGLGSTASTFTMLPFTIADMLARGVYNNFYTNYNNWYSKYKDKTIKYDSDATEYTMNRSGVNMNTMFRLGGKLKQLALGGEIRPVNSDTMVVKGRTHAQGGVVDTEGLTGAPGENEFENGELIKFNSDSTADVYSNKLGTSSLVAPLVEAKREIESRLSDLSKELDKSKKELSLSSDKFKRGSVTRKMETIVDEVNTLSSKLEEIDSTMQQIFDAQEQAKQMTGLTNQATQGDEGIEPIEGDELGEMKLGGKIHIKKENRGKFTAYAKAHGKSVQEMANTILANKSRYSPTLVKRAVFAKNFGGKKHEFGDDISLISNYSTESIDNPLFNRITTNTVLKELSNRYPFINTKSNDDDSYKEIVSNPLYNMLYRNTVAGNILRTLGNNNSSVEETVPVAKEETNTSDVTFNVSSDITSPNTEKRGLFSNYDINDLKKTTQVINDYIPYAATLIDNIGNLIITNKMRNRPIPEPLMYKAPKYQTTYDTSGQEANLRSDIQDYSKFVSENTRNSSVAASRILANKALSTRVMNQLMQDKANKELALRNAVIEKETEIANVNKDRKYQHDMAEYQKWVETMNLDSQNLANLQDDVVKLIDDKALKEYQDKQLGVLAKQYSESGVTADLFTNEAMKKYITSDDTFAKSMYKQYEDAYKKYGYKKYKEAMDVILSYNPNANK